MEKEVQHNIHIAMEILDQDLSPRDSKTDQRIQNKVEFLTDGATDPPMNHGDGIDMLEELPGPSSKTKTQIKRSRKRADTSIIVVLRESLHRESKSIAMEKIRNTITQYHQIVKKSRKILGGRVYRKRFMPKMTEAKKKNAQKKKKKKMIQERMIALSPISCDCESAVSGRQVSGKGSKESCESGSSSSGTSGTSRSSR